LKQRFSVWRRNPEFKLRVARFVETRGDAYKFFYASFESLTQPDSLIRELSMITTVTGKNQITIPAELARELDITPGTRFDWSKGGDGVIVAKIIPGRAELARRLAGRGKKYLRPGGDPIRDLIEDRVRDDRAERTP
jgi:AbrB family looped-hinge helix DNA binding protein